MQTPLANCAFSIENSGMLCRTAILSLLATLLGGCSYSYDVLAVARGGQIAFIVDPNSSSSPSCIRRIEIYAESERASVWRESVDYEDDCANKFPVAYGTRFKGRHQQEWPTIPAQSLRPGVVYEVSTTTGATGYGGGRFVIKADGSVENLKPSVG